MDCEVSAVGIDIGQKSSIRTYSSIKIYLGPAPHLPVSQTRVAHTASQCRACGGHGFFLVRIFRGYALVNLSRFGVAELLIALRHVDERVRRDSALFRILRDNGFVLLNGAV